jgi:tRNA A22 N-methylase
MLHRLLYWLFKKELQKEIDRAASVVKQAGLVKETADRRHYTSLECCEIDSEHYLRTLKEIWEENAFQYELLITETTIKAMIVDGKQDAALLGQGMLKGLDLLKAKLQAATLNWYKIREEKNAKVQS